LYAGNWDFLSFLRNKVLNFSLVFLIYFVKTFGDNSC
jgi:hypothetical protein